MAIGQKGGLLAAINDGSEVLNTVLTGFSVGSNTAITASDTILSAFGKTQGQINALSTGLGDYVKTDGSTPLTADWNIGNFNLGINTAPAAVFDVSKNISSTAWITNGIGLRWRAATYTDTTSSGAVAFSYIHTIASPTIASSSAMSTTGVTLFVGVPIAGTNTTLSNSYAIKTNGAVNIGGNINFDSATRTIGTTDANALQFQTNSVVKLIIGTSSAPTIGIGSSLISTNPILGLNITDSTRPSWTNTGVGIVMAATTFTDQSSSGTVASQYINVISTPTIAASSTTTYTLSGTMFIARPTAGTNVTNTNTASLVLGGNLFFNAGATGLFGTYDNQSLSIRTNNVAKYTISAKGAHQVLCSDINGGVFVNYVEGVSTSGVNNGILYTAASHTGQTASSEVTDINFNLSATKTWATGAIATQRDFRIQARTYAFASSSTVTTASTLAISGSPIAGSNATITNAFALNVESGISNFAGEVRIGNTVNVVSPTSPNRTITMVVGGTILYIAAKTTND